MQPLKVEKAYLCLVNECLHMLLVTEVPLGNLVIEIAECTLTSTIDSLRHICLGSYTLYLTHFIIQLPSSSKYYTPLLTKACNHHSTDHASDAEHRRMPACCFLKASMHPKCMIVAMQIKNSADEYCSRVQALLFWWWLVVPSAA